jgi:hypothetical protein
MINILIERLNPQTNQKETILKQFTKDKESILFLEQIESEKMQIAYNSLNLGIYNPKKPIRYTEPQRSSYLSYKPLTKKQKENNILHKKLCEVVTSINIKIWHD